MATHRHFWLLSELPAMSMTIPSVRREQVVRSFSSFSSFSRELQVKYQGHYSAARVQELAKYQRETSNYRAIAVLLLSLLPCIIATTVADVIPLQSPSLGIGRNPGFIARAFITHLIFSFLALTQFRLYVVGLQLSNTRMAIASILASLGTLAGDAALVYTIGFPLPFTFLLNSSVWLVCVLIALAFAGARQVILHDQHRRHFINATKVWSGQFCLVIAWPLYFTALKFTPKSYRPAIMVVLPVFKVLLRLGFSRALPHLRDEGPEIVTFNADMFSSLFMSYMAQSTTLLVTLALIFFDGLRTILFVREILKTYKQVGDLEEALCRVEEESESTTGDGKPTNVSVGMLHRASSILRKLRHEPAATKSFTKSSSKSRRLKLRILLLVQLRRQNTAVIPIPISQQNQSATRFLRIHSKRGIVPVPTRKSSWMENPRASSELPKGARLYIERAQQVLYTMEFIMLLNYVEFAVPAIYGAYLLITFSLPNRHYYHQFADLDGNAFSETMLNVLLYFTMQVFALGVICAVYERKFRVSGIKQIAFVLEKQCMKVQIKMVFWMFYLAQSTLEHTGYDYTFQFRWLQPSG